MADLSEIACPQPNEDSRILLAPDFVQDVPF